MLSVEKMTFAELDKVLEIEKACFTCPWSRASFEAELENPFSLWLTAHDDGSIAGFAGAQSLFNEASVMNVAVSPEFRRRGIARALLNGLYLGVHAEKFFLEVRASNVSAIALYESEGFRRISLRKRYYENPVEDAIIMEKEMEK